MRGISKASVDNLQNEAKPRKGGRRRVKTAPCHPSPSFPWGAKQGKLQAPKRGLRSQPVCGGDGRRIGMPSAVSVRRGRQRDQDAFLTQQEDVLPRRQLRAGARGHLAEDAGPGAERRQRLGRVSRSLLVPTLAISRGWGGLRHEGRGAGQELPLPRGGAPPAQWRKGTERQAGVGGLSSPLPLAPRRALRRSEGGGQRARVRGAGRALTRGSAHRPHRRSPAAPRCCCWPWP